MTAVLPEPAVDVSSVSPTRRTRALRWSMDHPVFTVSAVALVARVVCAVVISKIFGGVLFNDDSTYSGMARAVVEGTATTSWDDYTRHLYNSTAAYSLPLTALYWVLGPNQLAGQLLSASFAVASAACATVLALRLVPRQLALAAGLVVALLPSQVLFSSLTLKDPAVWATVAGLGVAVALANRATGRALAGPALAVSLLLVAVAHLRLHTFVLVIWSVAAAAWFGEPTWRVRRGVVAAAIAISLPWALGAGPGGNEIIRAAGNLENIRLANAVAAATAIVDRPPLPPSTASLTDAQRRLDEAERQVRAARRARDQVVATHGSDAPEATAAAAQVEAADRARAAEAAKVASLHERAVQAAAPARSSDDTWVRANVTYLPRGLAIVVLGPFVWDIGANGRVRLAGAELLVWYPLLVLAFLGLLEARKRADALVFPALVGAGTALMYGLAEGNFGTAYRHRGELVWVIAIFAAMGFSRVHERWTRRTT